MLVLVIAECGDVVCCTAFVQSVPSWSLVWSSIDQIATASRCLAAFTSYSCTLQEEEQDAAAREREVRQEVTRRIKQLGQQRKFKEAVQQLASLANLGIQPDTQAATALLAACTRSRDMKMAQSIFEQLFGEGPGLLWGSSCLALTSWRHSTSFRGS